MKIKNAHGLGVVFGVFILFAGLWPAWAAEGDLKQFVLNFERGANTGSLFKVDDKGGLVDIGPIPREALGPYDALQPLKKYPMTKERAEKSFPGVVVDVKKVEWVEIFRGAEDEISRIKFTNKEEQVRLIDLTRVLENKISEELQNRFLLPVEPENVPPVEEVKAKAKAPGEAPAVATTPGAPPVPGAKPPVTPRPPHPPAPTPQPCRVYVSGVPELQAQAREVAAFIWMTGWKQPQLVSSTYVAKVITYFGVVGEPTQGIPGVDGRGINTRVWYEVAAECKKIPRYRPPTSAPTPRPPVVQLPEKKPPTPQTGTICFYNPFAPVFNNIVYVGATTGPFGPDFSGATAYFLPYEYTSLIGSMPLFYPVIYGPYGGAWTGTVGNCIENFPLGILEPLPPPPPPPWWSIISWRNSQSVKKEDVATMIKDTEKWSEQTSVNCNKIVKLYKELYASSRDSQNIKEVTGILERIETEYGIFLANWLQRVVSQRSVSPQVARVSPPVSQGVEVLIRQLGLTSERVFRGGYQVTTHTGMSELKEGRSYVPRTGKSQTEEGGEVLSLDGAEITTIGKNQWTELWERLLPELGSGSIKALTQTLETAELKEENYSFSDRRKTSDTSVDQAIQVAGSINNQVSLVTLLKFAALSDVPVSVSQGGGAQPGNETNFALKSVENGQDSQNDINKVITGLAEKLQNQGLIDSKDVNNVNTALASGNRETINVVTKEIVDKAVSSGNLSSETVDRLISTGDVNVSVRKEGDSRKVSTTNKLSNSGSTSRQQTTTKTTTTKGGQ